MSGGASEYVMGNESRTADSYTFFPSNSAFLSSWYDNYSNQKYLNTYANGSTDNDQAAYNRARLGDATGEVVSSTGGSGGWYRDNASFLNSISWFDRGGYFTFGSNAGVFYFRESNGGLNNYISTRVALVWTLS